MQKDVVSTPKASSIEHLKNKIEFFDFTPDDADMKSISNLMQASLFSPWKELKSSQTINALSKKIFEIEYQKKTNSRCFMKKSFLVGLFFILSLCPLYASETITGFWKTIDDRSGKAQSIIAIYPYQGKYFGRIIATFNDQGKIKDSIYDPKERAPGVIGNPPYAGLDIIWNLQDHGGKLTNGKILDPQKGRIYGAEMWISNGNLIVRGKLLIFGRNQTWLPVADSEFSAEFKKPDLMTFVPTIPKVK